MMNWILHQTTSNSSTLPPIQLVTPPPPPRPPPPQLSEETNLVNRISPSILLIIVILAVIFFISGLLHLLVRYLLRPAAREPDDSDNITALQGQLQQLFHLHDSGVDQSFIDTLPVFMYKAVIGLKDPFDCAVCLCEFEPVDKLRLLPMCSHAFHVECIDTWLLSHSTCPLCRSSLVPDFSPSNICSPVVLVLESGSDSSREIGIGSSHTGDMGFPQEDDFGPPTAENSQKLGLVEQDVGSAPVADVSETKVVQVKLGKFQNVDASGDGVAGGGEGSSSSGNLDQRRCFSMGSYEYVMNETSLLQVAIKPSKKKPSKFKKPGHAMSECDCHSRREGFKGFDSLKSLDCGSASASARISTGKREESFSVSKTWLRSKKDKPVASEDSSRRAFSFRLPLHRESAAAAEAKAKCSVSPRTVSEFDADLDVEVGSCNNSMASFGSQLEEAPSFARRTLLWIVGKQSRVGSHNLS